MKMKELVELTNKRIGSLTFIELMEAMASLEDMPKAKADLLHAIRERDFEKIGSVLSMWVSYYHEKDIQLHDGL